MFLKIKGWQERKFKTSSLFKQTQTKISGKAEIFIIPFTGVVCVVGGVVGADVESPGTLVVVVPKECIQCDVSKKLY